MIKIGSIKKEYLQDKEVLSAITNSHSAVCQYCGSLYLYNKNEVFYNKVRHHRLLAYPCFECDSYISVYDDAGYKKVKLIFGAQFVGYEEHEVLVPAEATEEEIKSLFPKYLGVTYDENCSYVFEE